MNYIIKKASLEDLDETAELFNLYRVFYRQESNIEKGKAFLKERIYLCSIIQTRHNNDHYKSHQRQY